MYQLFGRGESYDDLERQLKQLPPHVMVNDIELLNY